MDEGPFCCFFCTFFAELTTFFRFLSLLSFKAVKITKSLLFPLSHWVNVCYNYSRCKSDNAAIDCKKKKAIKNTLSGVGRCRLSVLIEGSTGPRSNRLCTGAIICKKNRILRICLWAVQYMPDTAHIKHHICLCRSCPVAICEKG